MHPIARILLCAAASSAAALTAAAPAAADSIAYVKDGSVWLSTADGSRQFQVTSGGGYSAVSQSDDGHLVALHGDQLAYLDRSGTVLADIKTPVSTTSDPSLSFKGPFDPVISPDGSKVAYTYYWQYTGYDPYCNPSTNCYVKRLYHGVAYTSPNRLTAWDEPGMRRQSGWIHPFWVGSDRTMQSEPSIAPNEDMVMNEPGKDQATGFTRWFSHPAAKWWQDSDLTRSQRKLAGVTGEESDHILFAYVDGLPETGGDPHYPTQCPYEITEPKGKFEQVSWSPDGTTLAYSDAAGISTIRIPEFGATFGDCGAPSEDVVLRVPGGASPSFGPADVPAPRLTPPPGPGVGSGVGSGDGGGSGAGSGSGAGANAGSGGTQNGGGSGVVVGGPSDPPAAITLTSSKGRAPRLTRVLAKGLPLTVTVGQQGRLSATAKVNGKTVATARTNAARPGNRKVRLTISARARRSLAKSKAKSVTFTVTTTLRPKAGGAAVRQRAKITVRR